MIDLVIETVLVMPIEMSAIHGHFACEIVKC